jgi:hypothetical protein
MLHRFPTGLAGDKVHQKRLPRGAPAVGRDRAVALPALEAHRRRALRDRAGRVIWAVQMSTVEFHPWNSRREDTEVPDEWRIDLDPMPELRFGAGARGAHVAHEVLDELGAVGYPKTSGSKGLHVYVRIAPRGPQGRTPGSPRLRPRGRASRTRRRDDHLVAQGPRPRAPLRRLQPERPRPHDRRGLLGTRSARCPGLGARSAGTRSTTASRGTSPWPPCRRASPTSVTCMHDIDDHVFDIAPLRAWADRDEAEQGDGPPDP